MSWRTKYRACAHVRGLSPSRVPLSTSLSPWGQRFPPRRKKRARESKSPGVVGEKIGARERVGRNFASASESVGIASVQGRESRRTKRAVRRARGTGCRRLHGNEARRECDGNHGSRGFLSQADLSVPLSGLSSSSFSSSEPLPSAHGASERFARTPLLSSRFAKERWGGLGLARRTGERVFLFLPFHLRFARPPVNPFFRVQEPRVDLDAACE